MMDSNKRETIEQLVKRALEHTQKSSGDLSPFQIEVKLKGIEERLLPPQGCENADQYIGNPWIVTLLRYTLCASEESSMEHMGSDEIAMVEKHLLECAACREMVRNLALAQKRECPPDVEEEIIDLLIEGIFGSQNNISDDSDED